MTLAFLGKLKNSKITVPVLVEAISSAVESGVLAAGDRMPSTRELSVSLDTHRTTVARAFAQLKAQGYLVAERGSRTVVADTAGNTASPARGTQAAAIKDDHIEDASGISSGGPNRLFDWTDKHSGTAERLMLEEIDIATSGDSEDLNNGAIPADLLPKQIWQKVLTYYCQSDMESTMSCRSEIFGYPPLRNEIAKFLRRKQGIECSPDQVVLYSGTQAALAHLAELLICPDQIIACENPGYAGARELFRVYGAKVAAVPVDDDGIVTAKLPDSADWLYITPSCQDPTGAVLSNTRRQEIINWASKHQTAIIEDAWDSEFQYSMAPLPALFSLDRTGSVIFLYNFFRVLFPLTSLGVLVLPEKLVPLFRKSKYLEDRQFSTIEHYVLKQMLEKRYLEEHLHNLWKVFKQRRQTLLFELKQALRDDVEIVAEGAGMHIVARFSNQWTREQLVTSAVCSALPMVPTDGYYIDKEQRNEFMINFARLPVESAHTILQNFAIPLRQGLWPL